MSAEGGDDGETTGTAPAKPRRGDILVVDDEPLVGRLVVRALGRAHRVMAVTSGHDALAHLAAGERFDLVLCDLTMPEMSGMDLYDRIKALDEAQAARVVFLTGGAVSARAQEFMDRHPVLEKPFDLRDLEALVKARVG
jgi:two-component system, NtrC family, sensor kinase